MMVIYNSFTVTLTVQEVEAITDALHGAYKSINAEKQPVMAERKNEYRELRNGFASLINQNFMGLDA